ncbi:MAG: hypothetical protein IIB69_09355 [Proteobacteria bacterium]|nr:hypothetical protein [Pseudomonadota bacterium]
MATSYFNCCGISQVKPVCPKLVDLGYKTAVLCDNDAPDQLSEQDVHDLRDKGIHVCLWEQSNSTENQLFHDLPWQHVSALLATICENHDTLELASIDDSIRKDTRVSGQNLSADPADWPEGPVLREVMGDLANSGSWIKRMDYAGKAFQFALPLLPDASTLKSRLDALWNWIRNE